MGGCLFALPMWIGSITSRCSGILARAPAPEATSLGKERRLDTRKQRKSSLQCVRMRLNAMEPYLWRVDLKSCLHVRSLVFAVGGFSTFWQRLVSVAYVITIFWLVFRYWVIHKVTACLGITNKRSLLSLSVTTLKSVELYSSLQRRHVIWCVIDQSLEVDLTLHPWKMQQWVLSSELSITTKSLQLFFPASKISISFNIAMRKLSKCHSLFPFCLARFLLISFGNFFLLETRMSP